MIEKWPINFKFYRRQYVRIICTTSVPFDGWHAWIFALNILLVRYLRKSAPMNKTHEISETRRIIALKQRAIGLLEQYSCCPIACVTRKTLLLVTEAIRLTTGVRCRRNISMFLYILFTACDLISKYSLIGIKRC